MKNDGALREIIKQTLGECLGRCDWKDVTFICRPSQFARFLIARNDAGLPNGFKELSPELFVPQETTVFDVSGNKAEYRPCE